MAAAWEVWTLWWLAALQIAVAYWWWRGEHLEGTRFWVTGLFVLNGVAIALTGGFDLFEVPILKAFKAAADRWTNLFLFAISLVALIPIRNRRALRFGFFGLIGIATAGLTVATPDIAMNAMANAQGLSYRTPEWFVLLYEAPLWAGAGLILWAAARRLETEEGGVRAAWALGLGVLAVRFGELVGLWGVDSVLRLGTMASTGEIASVGVLALNIFRAGASISLFAGFAVLLRNRLRHRSIDPAFDLVLLLTLGGLLFALGFQGVSLGLIAFFTLATIRPVGFVAARARLGSRTFLEDPKGRLVLVGALLYLLSVVGVAAGTALGTPPLQALLIGSGITLLIAPGARWALARLPDEAAPSVGAPGAPPDWPVETDRVTLPDDWEDRLEDGLRSFADLPAQVREELAALARWQRLVLALRGAPEGNPLPAYERTTPGLHLVTQCPYADVGTEIKRANERWEPILEELGLEAPGAVSDPDEPLVRSTWGRAEGLESSRVKIYELTDFGEKAGDAIAAAVGLGDQTSTEVAEVLGEAFPQRV